MTDTPSVAAAVATAAEAVRTANHATLSRPTTATDAYDVVGALVEVVARLQPLLGHLARRLRTVEPTAYFDDRGADPEDALILASVGVLDAHDLLDTVRLHVTDAHNCLGHLGLVCPED